MKPFPTAPVLTEQVRHAIVDAIVAGDLRAGERLAQEDIARRLGVSRQPVSHALRVLREQGVLVDLGRKGLTVAPMEAPRLRALYAVRGALDALAAREAAARVARGEADPEVVAALRALLDRQRAQPARKRKLTALVDDDVRFHVCLYRLSGNPVLEEISEPQWVHFRRCMHAVLEDRALRGEVWPEHAEILEAVLAGDAERAARLAENHARRAGEMTADRLAGQNTTEQDTTT